MAAAAFPMKPSESAMSRQFMTDYGMTQGIGSLFVSFNCCLIGFRIENDEKNDEEDDEKDEEEDDDEFEAEEDVKEVEAEEENNCMKSDSNEEFNTSFSKMVSRHTTLHPAFGIEEAQSYKELCRTLCERFGSLFV